MNILQDINGTRLKAYSIDIINDELSVFDEDNDPFTYNPKSQQSQLVQQTLFTEKQTLIENCLFGVDINPNSVKICRLRLWIELLKNAYYKQDGNLETLPNIDINIKCGNSLISRFKLKDDEFKNVPNFKKRIADYTKWVNDYKNVKDRDKKKYLSDNIKLFNAEFKKRDPQLVNKEAQLTKLLVMFNDKYIVEHLFEKDQNSSNQKEKEILKQKIELLKDEIDHLKNNVIYKNAFEWRFEFPEVLNSNGDFEGFDIIIGNPPYGVSLKEKLRDVIVNSLNKVPDFEIYYFFINLAKKLLKPGGIKSYIIPNTILFNVFAKNYRENLFTEWQINEILDCTNFNVFEGSATVRCIITLFINEQSIDNVFYRPTLNATSFKELISRNLSITDKRTLLANNQNWALIFKLDSSVISLVSKIRNNKEPLIKYFPEISQGLIAYDKYQGQDKETIKNRIYHSNYYQIGWKNWLWGEDVNPFIVRWNTKEFFNYVEGVANRRDPKFFLNDRILIREITNPQIYGGFTSEEYYHDPALIVVLKNENGDINIKALLAIINSRLATFYHFNSSPKATKGAFPKILVEDIKRFPIPLISVQNQRIIIELVNEIIEAKKQGQDTAALEQQIDGLVYELYELTPDEIAIVEGSKH